MGRFSPQDYQQVRDLVERQVNNAARAASTATPQQASNIVNDTAKYPYLSPQVVTLLNQANASQTTKDVANYAVTHQALQQGQVPDPGTVNVPGSQGSQGKGWFDRLTDVTSYLNPFGKRGGEAVDSKIAGAWSWAEQNSVTNKFTGAIKGIVRGATTALASGYQAEQNYIGQNIDLGMRAARTAASGDIGGAFKLGATEAASTLTGGGDPNNPNGGVINDLRSTDLAQTAENWTHQGSGFFAGQDIQKASALKAEQTRGVDPGGHAWTIGRFVTTGLPQDSFIHKAVSGTVDMAAALSLDPVQIHAAAVADTERLGAFGQRALGPLGSRIVETRANEGAALTAKTTEAIRGANYASKAADVFGGLAHEAAAAGDFATVAEHAANASSWAQHAATLADSAENFSGITKAMEKVKAANPEYVKALSNAAGIVDSAKGQSALLPDTFKWFLSESGQKTVETLRQTNEPLDVMALYGGAIHPNDAYAIAHADTNEGVIGALGDALTHASDGLRSPNLIASPSGLNITKSVQDRFPDLARALGKVPNSTLISPEFPAESVQNMFDVLGNAKITGPQRRGLVNNLITAFATEDPGLYYQTAKETSRVLEDTLVQAGMHPEDASKITRYVKDEEAIKAYSSFDMASHMPFAYTDGAASPLRVTQTLQGAWSLMDPEKLLEARQQTSATAALLGSGSTKRRAPLVAMDWYQTRLFKPAAILRPALAGRLLPDEALRVLFGGHVGSSGSALMAMMNAPKTDALGRVFNESQRFNELEKAITKADKLTANGSQALQALRDGAQADDIVKLVPKAAADEVRSLIAEREGILSNSSLSLDDLFGPSGDRLTDIDQAIAKAAGVNDEKLSRMIAERENILRAQGGAGQHIIDGVLVGHGNATIASRLDGRINDSILYKTGSHVVLDTADKRYTNLVPKAMAEELVSQSADPVYRRLAIGGLLPGDVVDGVAHTGKMPSTIDDVERWLTSGDGRQYLEKYAKGIGVNPDEIVHDWVQGMAADIEMHWGQNQEARRAIATGQLRGEALRAPKQWGPRQPPSDETLAAMREIIDAGDAPAKIRYQPTIEEARRHQMTQAMRYNDMHNKITDWAFGHFYGNMSDKFIRIPEYANSYWANAEQMIPKLSPEAGQQLIKSLDEAGGLHGDAEGWLGKLKDTLTSDSQEKRIRLLAASASGDSKLEDVDKLAHGYALDDVKRLMFDMDRKNQFQDMTRLLFPFGRAWWEVISTWSKIALGEGHEPLLGAAHEANVLQQGLAATKAVARAGENVAGIAHVVDRDVRAFRGNGWFYRDENGQEVFNYPASGALGAMVSKMTGTPGVDQFFRGKVSGLSIGLQVTPGLGPVFSIPTYALMQKAPVPSAVVDMVFPFGQPKSISDAALPSWMAKLQAGFSTDEQDPIYANTFMEVTRALSNSGKYGTDQASLDKLLADAHKQAAALTVLRGVSQAVSPSAPIPTYIAKTKQGDMTTVLLAKKLNELRSNPELVKSLGYANANEAFIGTYGPQTMAYLIAKTKTLSGGETASSAFGRWEQSNSGLVKDYKNVYGFFGPQAAGYDAAVVQRQINMGNRKQNTPNDVLALANAKAADMIYYGIKDGIVKDNATLGVKNLTPEQTQWLTEKRKSLEKAFPGWDTIARGEESQAMKTKQFNQLAQAVNDRRVLATPTGQSLATYWGYRDKVIAEAKNRGITGWQTANATSDLRDWLGGKAKQIAQNDNGFASMFDYLLSSETKD